jgi:hypothetical protein
LDIFGIVAPPGQTAYAAAKFAVRGFSEGLRHGLQTAKSPVRHAPSRSSGSTRSPRPHPPPRCASSLGSKRTSHASGNDARFMDLLQRFRPATYWAVIARKIEKMAQAGK